MPHFGDLLERIRQLGGVVHLQIDLKPFFRHQAPLDQSLRLQPRLDGQQAQARHHVGVIAQFGRTHGGPPGACRHDAAAITGKENGIDQLGLSARELRNECHHDLVGAQLCLQLAHPVFDRRVEQALLFQPLGQQFEAQGEFTPPGAMLVKLFVERHALWS